MENTRRNFLKKSLIGISGAAVMPSLIPAQFKTPLLPEGIIETKTRTLGRTGIKLPIVSMGTGDTKIKWVLNNENITTVVSGMTTFDELQGNMILLNDIRLTEQELKDLKFASNNSGPGLYCQQCHECISQCRHGIDVPTFMRSYMYAYGYRNPLHAKYTLEMTGIKDVPCTSCPECTVQCAVGFDVRSKISDIARLKDIPSDFLRI